MQEMYEMADMETI